MNIPYPKPTTPEQCRMNAIHCAEEATTGGMSFPQTKYLANVAQAWATIADTFPHEEATDTEETFQAWTARNVDKLSDVLQETMTRVDRLEARAGGRVQVAVSGQDEQFDWMHTFLSPEEWRVVKELRAGRLVTHTPDYVADLRKDAVSDEERADLDLLRRLRRRTLGAAEAKRRPGSAGQESTDTAMVALQPDEYAVLRTVIIRAVTAEKGRAIIVDQKDIDALANTEVTVRPMTLGSRMWQVRTESRPV